MDYRTPLAKVRGLGSAHHGSAHWWMQRITGLVLSALCVWLILFCQQLSAASYEQIILWLTQPVHSFAAISWTLVAFYHAALGLRVIIEDYIPHQGKKIALIWTINVLFCALAGLSGLAVLKIVN